MGRRFCILLAAVGLAACTTRNPAWRSDGRVAGDQQPVFDGMPIPDWLVPRPEGRRRDQTIPQSCGNGICEPSKGENCQSCPKDCPRCCGNGKCEPTFDESCQSCPSDCPCGCKDLETLYQLTLQQAKVCSPWLAILQCDLVMPSKIVCGCPTHVNAGQTTAVALLKSLRNQFQQKCGSYPCPDVPCPATSYGLCLPNTSNSNGSCIDK